MASGNVHAHDRSRAELQDAFVALRHHTTLDASETLRRGNHSHVMTTPRAMVARFTDHPEAVRETLNLAELLRFDLTKDLGYSYPGAEDESALRSWGSCAGRAWRSASRRRRADSGDRRIDVDSGASTRGARAEAQARLEEELRVISKLGLAGFFLLHHEMLELAREVAMRYGTATRPVHCSRRGEEGVPRSPRSSAI